MSTPRTMTSAESRLRIVGIILVVFNVVMLIVAIPPLLRGDVDSYHNEHARSVASALSGILLTSSLVVRPPAKLMLLLAASLAIGFTFYLMLGHTTPWAN